MNSAISYWISLMGSWWSILVSNTLLSISVVAMIFTFVFKYLDKIKKIFK